VTLWHLLWLFLSANGALLLMLVTPVLFTWAMAGQERGKWRFFDWRIERRRRGEIGVCGCYECTSRDRHYGSLRNHTHYSGA
jgi:hypothetical protein